MQSYEEALDIAIAAIKHGEPQKGKAALTWVLKHKPDHPLAWIWLASCVDDEQARKECYRRASAGRQAGVSQSDRSKGLG